jgi:hypothetical protein
VTPATDDRATYLRLASARDIGNEMTTARRARRERRYPAPGAAREHSADTGDVRAENIPI